MSRLCVSLIACGVFFLAAPWAWGRTSADYMQYLKQVKRFYRDGVQLTNRKQYKRAAVFYLEALRWVRKAMPLATVVQRKRLQRSEGSFLYVIGRNYQMGGRCRLAARYFRQALTSAADVSVKTKATSFLEQARAMPACRPVAVAISTTPPAARLMLSWGQQRHRGTTPWRGQLEPGRWKLRVQQPGGPVLRRHIDIKPGQPRTLHYTFANKKTTSPVARRGATWPRWLLLGGAVALIAGGAVALGWAGSEFAAVSAQQGRPIDGVAEPDTYGVLKPRIDGGTAGMGAGIAMLGVGAVVGGIAAWWLLQTPKAPPKAAGAVLPVSRAAVPTLQENSQLSTRMPQMVMP